jgi:hypothetical protein
MSGAFRHPGLVALVAGLCVVLRLSGETILTEAFEAPSGWQTTVRGNATAEIVPEGIDGNCLRVRSEGGFAYYSLALDLARVRGKRITVRCAVRLADVRVGAQRFNTAKLHVGVTVAGTLKHFPTLLAGTEDWHDQSVSADVPETAEKVVVDLGNQEGFGTAWYDDLTVDDGVREHEALDLTYVFNTALEDAVPERGTGGFIDAGELDLRGLPVGDVRFAEVDFFISPPQRNGGRACLVLGGKGHPEWPLRPTTAVLVRRQVPRLFFLHASAWAEAGTQQPCLIYDSVYEDGQRLQAVMREGIAIGSFQGPQPLPAWRVAWTAARGEGTVGLGVTVWENPRPDVALAWLRPVSTGQAGVPVIVAISAAKWEP